MHEPAKLHGLIVLSIAMYIVPFDYIGIGLAAPQIRGALGFSPAALPWMLGGYVLTFGSFLVLGGRLGDLYGRRRMLLLGLAIFGTCSALTAMAPNPGWFLAARVAKGIGSALLSPNALALQNVIFSEGRERNRAYGTSSFVGGLFSAAYLLSAGVLLSYSWRWLLLMNVPLVLILAPLVLRFVSESRGREAQGSFDVGGALLSVAAFGALSLAIANAVRLGVSSLLTLGLALGSIVLFAVLLRVETRHARPLFPPQLFRTRNLVGAYVVCFFWSASNTNYPLNLFLQDALHYTAQQASFALLPTTLVAAAGAFLSARLPERIGLRLHLFGFLLLEMAGIACYAFLSPQNGYWSAVLPAALMTNIGFFSVWMSVRLLAISGVPDADQGVASGAIFSMQQLGNAVGIPALAAVLNAVTETHGGVSPAARLLGFHWMFVASNVLLLLAILSGALILRRIGRPAPPNDAALTPAATRSPSPEPAG